MKKQILLIVLIFIVLGGCDNVKETNKTDFNGELLILNPTNKVMDKDTVSIYNIISKKTISFGEKYCDWPVFNKDKNKLLVINDSGILEYDCNNFNSNYIFQGKYIEHVCYIPGKENISFIQNNKLYTYDIVAKEKKYILDVDNGYSWNKDGSKLIYCKDGKIYTYELSTQNNTYFTDGINPQYSNNSQLLCYKKHYKGSKQMLVIKELNSNKQWEYKTNGIASFRFSPDDRFIALEESKTKNFFTSWDLIVWNFQIDKKEIIIQDVINPSQSIDWK
jgi:hypothetical protein